MGLEPMTPWTTTRCSNQLSYTHHADRTANSVNTSNSTLPCQRRHGALYRSSCKPMTISSPPKARGAMTMARKYR